MIAPCRMWMIRRWPRFDHHGRPSMRATVRPTRRWPGGSLICGALGCHCAPRTHPPRHGGNPGPATMIRTQTRTQTRHPFAYVRQRSLRSKPLSSCVIEPSADTGEHGRLSWGSNGRRFKSRQPDRETPVRPVYLADLVLESARANPLIPASSQRAGAESGASSICWPDQRRGQRSSPAQSPRLR